MMVFILAGSLKYNIVVLAIFLSSQTDALLIEKQPIVANLFEKVDKEEKLVCIPCTADDMTKVKVSKVSVTPATACYDCFQIYDKVEDGAFCLYYLYSQSDGGKKLDYSLAHEYNIEVICTDGGDLSTSANVQVRVVSNEPPTVEGKYNYKCDPVPGVNSKKGDEVFKVPATDPDGDAMIYSMKTDPPTTNFEIGPDGVIRTTQDLTHECNPVVTFYVNISDKYKNSIGPLVITCPIKGVISKPIVLLNANKKIVVSEDAQIGHELIKFQSDPDFVSGSHTYNYNTVPLEALALLDTSQGNIVKLNSKLNFEDSRPNYFNISVTPSNSYCKSQTYWLHVDVVDANDPPYLGPKDVVAEIDEGDINVNILEYFTLTDEDVKSGYDSWRYKILSGNDNNYFRLTNTGQLIANDYYVDKRDQNRPEEVTLKIQVNDTKGEGEDTVTLTLKIRDINDNAPVFSKYYYTDIVSECQSVGNKLLSVTKAKDKIDTDFRQNNVVECVPAYNDGLRVDSNCAVYLDSAIPGGTAAMLDVYARDLGSKPGPLRSAYPVSVLVRSTPCTTTTIRPTPLVVVRPANPAVVTSTTTVTVKKFVPAVTTPTPPLTPIPTGSCTGILCDTGTLVGLIFAGLAAMAMLGFLGYLIYKKCFPCKGPTKKWDVPKTPKPGKPKTPPKPKTPKPKTPPRKVKPESPPPKTPEPPPRSPTPEPHIYDFWKERYPDDDYATIPTRTDKPTAITANQFAST